MITRIECAARMLVYVQDTYRCPRSQSESQDNKPGDDLADKPASEASMGQEDTALVMIELRAALQAMDEYRGTQPFDPESGLEELKRSKQSQAW